MRGRLVYAAVGALGALLIGGCWADFPDSFIDDDVYIPPDTIQQDLFVFKDRYLPPADTAVDARPDVQLDAQPDTVTDAAPDSATDASKDAKGDALVDAPIDALTDVSPTRWRTKSCLTPSAARQTRSSSA